MAYYVEIKCPTCDTVYSFEVMMSEFGINTYKMKPFAQCKKCYEKD